MAAVPSPAADAVPAAGLDALAAFLDAQPEPHVVIDRAYRIRAVNAAYHARFGDGGTVVGRTCHEVSHHSTVPCDQAGEQCPLAAARRSGRRERVLHLHHTPQGDRHVAIDLVPLAGTDGSPVLFVERMEPLAAAGNGAAPDGLVGRSPPFLRLLEQVARVGPSDAGVLLLGESGSGKELVARAVHRASARAARPLVVVDCASLPETLFESELFGHERGAFTGAHRARAGLAEAASGGTLFLDEVGDIPLAMQVKLLRLLETGTFRRVGGTELRRADLRVVAATHRDLEAMVAGGRFRQDLYYRLGVFPIELPPLRERLDDLPLLVPALLARVAPGRPLRVTADGFAALARHPFPGNVRELRNVLERAALLADGDVIDAGGVARALPARRAATVATLSGHDPSNPHPGTGGAAVAWRRRDARDPAGRRAELLAALARHGHDRRAAARALGISLRTLYRRLGELDRIASSSPDG